jgi:hypothetical protein
MEVLKPSFVLKNLYTGSCCLHRVREENTRTRERSCPAFHLQNYNVSSKQENGRNYLMRNFLIFTLRPVLTWSRHNSVGIATDYGLDGRGIGVRVPVASKKFLFSTSSRPTLGPTQPPIQWVPDTISQRGKAAGV